MAAQGNEFALEITRSVPAAYGWTRYRSSERSSSPIPPATRARPIGTYAIPGLGTFAATLEGSSLALSLKEGAIEPLYASSPDTIFILSTDLVLHVTSGPGRVSVWIVTGPFDVAFQKEG